MSKEIYFLLYKMRSFSLYSDCRWNGFSKTEELGKQLSFDIMYIYSIFYKSIFLRIKPFILEQKLRIKLRTKSGMLNIKSKVSRLAILKTIGTKQQNRTWLSLILYCI